MLGGILSLAVAFQIGPFYQQKSDYAALRPIVAAEDDVTDVLWPVFTSHRDWWRFCYIVNYQAADTPAGRDDFQFTILPIWFNGRADGEAYWGFFPLWGHHPHVLMMHEVDFALWPLWTRYRMPRGRDWLVTNSVLFPFFSWRSDGAWSFWPLYGLNHQRESDHRYALWPLATWASYRADRDTAGEGWSWMFWPLYGQVRRERESQDLFLPPFFSWTETWSKTWAAQGNSGPELRLRCPWPFFEWEETARRSRLSIWPLYENVKLRNYSDRKDEASVMRFGWKLVEIYDDEVRVFPFWASGKGHFRLWPLWESESGEGSTAAKGVTHSRFLALFPIRWVPAIDRNWAKFWTFYENRSCPLYTDHSLLWGIIRWRSATD